MVLCLAGHNAWGSLLKLVWAVVLATSCALPLQADEITVFAASSLKTALDQVAADWQVDTGNTVVLAYDGSAKLAKQIEQGAPADMFVSAAEVWMDHLQDQGAIQAGTRRDILGNRLVLVAHGQGGGQDGGQDGGLAAPVTIGPDFDLAGMLAGGKLAMGMTASVPAGQYGHEALVSLGLWDSVAGSVVETDNVRAAVKLVALGEAPLGIVFASDAVAETGVSVAGTFPESSHAPIVYPAALTTSAKGEAQGFLDYLSSPAAKARFAAQGFGVIP